MITIYNNIGEIILASEASEEVTERIAQNAIIQGSSYLYGYYDPSLYYISDGVPILKPEKPTKTGIYDFDYVLKKWVINLKYETVKVINIRNSLLQQTDWTDTVSAKTRLGDVLYEEWQTYRQSLRDIPNQEGFPLNVIWPVAPT